MLPNPPCQDFRASYVYEEGYVPLQRLQKRPVVHNGMTRKARNLKSWTDDQEGYCGGSDFSLHGLEYADSILQATYEIFLYDGTMIVHLESDLVRTYSGTTCEYSMGHGEDYVYGNIFWNKEEHDRKRCDEDTYVVLYEGKDMIRSYQETAITEAAKVVTVTDDSTVFSLIQAERLLLCNHVAFRSEQNDQNYQDRINRIQG